MIGNVRTVWIRKECCEILDSLIPRLFICRSVTGKTMLLQMSIPVDARYFARGGVCDAELEAMKVLCLSDCDVLLCGADKTIL
jgi:hypothetical protein